MNTSADLKLLGVAEVDGQPLACPDCDNTFSLEVHKRSVFETAPAWVCCLACGSGHESATVTTGLVDAVLTRWNQRRDQADRDTFTAEWRGTVLAGELVPTLDFHQTVGAVREVHKAASPHLKRWWRGKKRTARAKVRAPWTAAKGKAGTATSGVKVAALAAAWTMQTGGAGAPQPRTRRRCTVKGCRGGWLTIKTRIHSSTGAAKIRCAVCGRADD